MEEKIKWKCRECGEVQETDVGYVRRYKKLCHICSGFLKEKECQVCGSKFTALKNTNRKTCSEECHAKLTSESLKSRRVEYSSTCKMCGRDFVSFSAKAIYCSKKCRNKACYRKLTKEERKQKNKEAFYKNLEEVNKYIAETPKIYGGYNTNKK